MRVSEVMLRLCHTLVTPKNILPRYKFLFLTKTAFQSKYVDFHDVLHLTVDSVFIGQFSDFIFDSVIVEIIGPKEI